ncbi:MAG: hypothetical protein V4671_29030 [Armatimonadota bacterium]
MNRSSVLILGNDDIAVSLQRTLKCYGYMSYCTASIKNSLHWASEFSPFCIVVADVIFSRVSFWEAVSQLRAAIGNGTGAILIWRKDVTQHYIENGAIPYISLEKGQKVVFWASHPGSLPGANGVPGRCDVHVNYPVKPAELIRFVELISGECSES